jgi:hypothetical protein
LRWAKRSQRSGTAATKLIIRYGSVSIGGGPTSERNAEPSLSPATEQLVDPRRAETISDEDGARGVGVHLVWDHLVEEAATGEATDLLGASTLAPGTGRAPLGLSVDTTGRRRPPQGVRGLNREAAQEWAPPLERSVNSLVHGWLDRG